MAHELPPSVLLAGSDPCHESIQGDRGAVADYSTITYIGSPRYEQCAFVLLDKEYRQPPTLAMLVRRSPE